MDHERERHAAALLDRVRSLPELERRTFLNRECAGDPDLRAVVVRRLAEMEMTSELPELPTVEPNVPSAATRSSAPLRAGQHFGDFRLQRLLGTGGFAQVWEAEDSDGRRIALKVLNQIDPSREAIERFEREGRLTASLNHPRCVYVFGAFEIEGHPTIAMELVPAGSLEDRLREHGVLPPKEAVDRILEILEGLEAAHRLGIIHRDVKPSNCFLDADGHAKIGDFGISRSLELDTDLTATGSFLGTPSYASPEQIRGDVLDARSDLHAVGATIYTLLTGTPPFDAQNAGKLLSQILAERPGPLSERGVQVPRGLERVVLRLLEKDPSKRYTDCASTRAALIPFSSRGLAFAGIAGRPGAFVLDSLLTSALFWVFYAMADLSSVDASRSPTLGSLGADLLLSIAWFATFETLWAGTPCKRLLGLRVTGPEGQRASLRSVLVRNLVFFVGINALPIAAVTLGGGDEVFLLFALSGIAIVSSTMRPSNGFAGLHELASGTRVMQSRKVAARRKPELAVGPGLVDAQTPAEAFRGQMGPYRVEGRIAYAGDADLRLGRDDALSRMVWIRIHSARPTDHWSVNRPGRLRRLLRGEDEGESWEAFEAPGGVSLMRWVETRGRLSWDETRPLLTALVEELRTGREQGDLPARISLDHLWVDASGGLRLLDFPLRRHPKDEASADAASSEWGVLLHQLTVLALEGRLARPADRDGQIPRLPLPEHAREIVAGVCDRSEEQPSLASLHNALRESATTPTRVTRRQRGMALAMSALPVVLPALLVAFALSHGELRNGVSTFTWRFVLGLLNGVGVAMAIGALPAVVLTFLFRGGPWIRFFGIRVQTRDGKRASRRRCLLRGVVVYSPALLMLAMIPSVLALDEPRIPLPPRAGESTGYAIGRLIGAVSRSNRDAVLLPLTGALFIAGAAQSLVRPERGFADGLARTHLVPR